MTTVQFVKTTQNPPEIRQSRIKRDWMDDTYKKHAYQCMPMSVANVLGWELVLSEDVVVQWDGGNLVPKILSGEKTAGGFTQVHCSIIGMVSFAMGWVVRTEENYSTWFSGSPNYLRDDAQALSATVPTFWWPDEVQMNWKINKVGVPVTFRAGEPFCFFNIYDNRAMLDLDVSVSNLWDDKELVEQRIKYDQFKTRINTEKPWTWAKGIKTGLDADGNVVGPTFTGLPVISVPNE